MDKPFPFALYTNATTKSLSNTPANYQKRLMRNALTLRSVALRAGRQQPQQAHRRWLSFMAALNDMTPEQHNEIVNHVGGIDELYPMEYTHLAPLSLLPEVDDPNPRIAAQLGQNKSGLPKTPQI